MHSKFERLLVLLLSWFILHFLLIQFLSVLYIASFKCGAPFFLLSNPEHSKTLIQLAPNFFAAKVAPPWVQKKKKQRTFVENEKWDIVEGVNRFWVV